MGGAVVVDLNGAPATTTLTLTGSIGPITLTFEKVPASLAIEPVTVLNTKSYEVAVPCFAAAARFLTDAGCRNVENLREGDRLITPTGYRGRSSGMVGGGRLPAASST